MSSTDTPLLDFARRYVIGRVVNQDVASLHFVLDTNPGGGHRMPQWARVTLDRLPEGKLIADYPQGTAHRLFLIEPTSQDPTLWFASLAWAWPVNNPWDASSYTRLRLGDSVTGTVREYVKDFAAIVVLDGSSIEAFLHWEDVPEGRKPISALLQIGDRIKAVVKQIDEDRLHIKLSVLEAVEAARSEFEYEASTLPRSGGAPTPIAVASELPEQPFASLEVLLVENTPEFGKHLRTLLQCLGAKATLAGNPQHVAELLEKRPSHILADFHLEGPHMRREMFKLLRRANAPVALMSGDYVEARKAAAEEGWAFLPKPVSYADLHGWLLHGENPEPQQDESSLSESWSLGVESRSLLRRAESALGDFCRRTGNPGAFWVRPQRAGAFAVLSAFGIDRKRLAHIEARFGQSLVADVSEEGKLSRQVAEHAGPLQELTPAGAVSIWGIPLGDRTEKGGDALIVFSPVAITREDTLPGEAPPAWRSALEPLSTRLEDLDEMAMLAERLREAESFATLGRVAGSLLHEIRQAIQQLEGFTVLARTHLNRKAPAEDVLNEIRGDMREIAGAADRVMGVARAKLYNLQKARPQEINLNLRIPEILGWYQPRAQEESVHLLHTLPQQAVVLNLPPEAVEQPLANLLDNSFHHMGGRNWGKIHVEVLLAPGDVTHPVHIYISDQGHGMTAEQRDALFTPRVSAKGAKGYGLGLYASRQLLRAIGGELECIESWRWLGSTFRIRLPLQIGANIKEGRRP